MWANYPTYGLHDHPAMLNWLSQEAYSYEQQKIAEVSQQAYQAPSRAQQKEDVYDGYDRDQQESGFGMQKKKKTKAQQKQIQAASDKQQQVKQEQKVVKQKDPAKEAAKEKAK